MESALDILKLGQNADVTIQASTTVFYMGYCIPGATATSEAKWAVKKVTFSNDPATLPYTITTKWANGFSNPETAKLIFDNYASFTYLFRKI